MRLVRLGSVVSFRWRGTGSLRRSASSTGSTDLVAGATTRGAGALGGLISVSSLSARAASESPPRSAGSARWKATVSLPEDFDVSLAGAGVGFAVRPRSTGAAAMSTRTKRRVGSVPLSSSATGRSASLARDAWGGAAALAGAEGVPQAG